MSTKVTVPFYGITRNTDSGISKDGECLELINARIKNGSVQPIGRPVILASLNKQYSGAYYHPNADKYLFIRNSDGGIDVYENDFKTYTVMSTSVSGVLRIEFIGNIVCLFKETALEYCIYINGSYTYLGQKPTLPKIFITQDSINYNVTVLQKYRALFTDGATDPSICFENISDGYMDDCISNLNKKGYFIDRCLVRYAFRMFDGSYILHSPVYLVQRYDDVTMSMMFSQTDSKYYITEAVGRSKSLCFSFQSASKLFSDFDTDRSSLPQGADLMTWEVGAVGFKPYFGFPQIDSSSLSAWKDIIVGIDVFVSKSIMDFEKKEKEFASGTTSGVSGKYYQYKKLSSRNIWKKVVEESKFYLAAEFDLNGRNIRTIDNVSNDNLVLQKELDDDAFTHNYLNSECSYVYNSMLHLGGIKQRYFEGYTGYDFSKGMNWTNVSLSATIYTYISTSKGVVIVKNTTLFPEPMTPFIMYPDARAFKMVILVTSGGTVYRKEFTLNKHQYLNLAYYYDETDNSGTTLNSLSYTSWSTGTDDILSESNAVEIREDTMRVSSVNNPFFFPAAHTYQPSGQKIIAMRSNTTALSQGQFGQHPLYIFCANGIYGMTVGDSVAYSTCVPISRDVCNNADSVRGLDQAVTFSSEQGLMIIEGSQVSCISKDIEGYLPSLVDTSPIIPKIMNVAKLYGSISTVIFHTYCAGANVGYNYAEKEIIVSNPGYNYSYVYSLVTHTWCKMSAKVAAYINTYPSIYSLVNETLSDGNIISTVLDMHNSHRSVSTVCLITRPIKMGSNAHKRILQSAFRGMVIRSMSDLYLRGEQVQFRNEELDIFKDVGLYILGSNDAENFELISGKEKMTDLRDLVTKMNKSKPYKFFMVALVGGVRTDVALNYMEFMVDESFNNRLR